MLYRWVDDQGRVHYSDTPVADRSTVIISAPQPAKSGAQPDSKAPGQPDSKAQGQSNSKAPGNSKTPAQADSKTSAQADSKAPAQANSKSSAQAADSKSPAQSDSKGEELEAPKPESVKKVSAQEAADRRQQLAYLEKRAVAKPVDNPERTKSRELDSNYRQNLAVYESAKATRDVHAEFIAQNCGE